MADIFVDYSATNNGNGTAYTHAASAGAAGAFNTLNGITGSDGDKVWVRRVVDADATTNWVISDSNLFIIGWPKSGDKFYSTRPSAPQATWDADAADYPEFVNSSGSNYFQLSGSNNELHRLKVTVTTTNGSACFTVSGSSNILVNCVSISTNDTRSGFDITGHGNHFYSCHGKGKGYFDYGDVPGGGFNIGTNALNNLLQNCTVESINASGNYNSAFVDAGIGTVFINCTMTSTHDNGSGLYLNSSKGTKWIGGYLRGSVPIISSQSIDTYNLIENVEIRGKRIIISGIAHHKISIKSWDFISGDSYHVEWYNASAKGELYLQDTAFSGGTNNLRLDGHILVLSKNVTYSTSPIFYPITTEGDSYHQLGGFYSADHGQVAGAYYAKTQTGVLESTGSVTRDGGSALSLKFTSTAKKYLPLVLGRAGFETMFVSVSAGVNTITFYGAYKTYTSLKKNDIWFEADYKDHATNLTTSIATSLSTNGLDTVDSDSSTWTGDTVTAFKITATFDAEQDCIVPIRLYFNSYVASGIVYLDPVPTIT